MCYPEHAGPIPLRPACPPLSVPVPRSLQRVSPPRQDRSCRSPPPPSQYLSPDHCRGSAPPGKAEAEQWRQDASSNQLCLVGGAVGGLLRADVFGGGGGRNDLRGGGQLVVDG